LAAATPWAVLRILTNAKARSRWRAYLADVPVRFGRRRRRLGAAPCVWVHGVSVGEVKAAARLVERIQEQVPGVEIVLSVTTDTGRRVAEERYPDQRVEYYPPDASWIVKDALDAIRPDLMVLVESELWPNFLLAARRRGLPVVLVNGRMSDRSARRFGRVPWVGGPLVRALDHVFVQIPAYAERYRALGVHAGRLAVTGNMKFDNIPFKGKDARPQRFARLLGLEGGAVPILVAGSTHPGEERQLVRVQRRLAAQGRHVRLVVAPRHPGRRDAVEADIRREGAQPVLRSRLSDPPEGGSPPRTPEDAVVVLDSVGELESVYGLADLVFVGGTLVPHGGQNMMEPASLGKPVVVGPHVGNFRGEVAMLLQAGGLRLVSDLEGLEQALAEWLGDMPAARDMGARARDAILASKGATERTLEGLAGHLQRLGAAPPLTPAAGSPSGA
jgi:3-deoxy-D-manno-octulosonic-acid transferase